MAESSCEVSCSMPCRRAISQSASLRLDGVEFADDAGSHQMAGVAVSGVDILAGKWSRSTTKITQATTPEVQRLWRCVADDRNDQCRRPHHLPRPGRSCDQIYGQRIVNTHRHPASGRASALRANCRSTTIFKTRITPCRIAVRADHEKCDQLTENRRRFCGLITPFVNGTSEVSTISRVFVRFTDD